MWRPQQWPRAPYVHVPLPLPRRRKRALGVVAGVAGLAVAVTAGAALAGGFDGGGSAPVDGAAAPSQPGAVPPSGNGGGATGAPEPSPSGAYQWVRVPAGYGVSVHADPPLVQAGTYSGDFGLTPGADAFAVEARHGTLVLLGPHDPGTLAGCRNADTPEVTSVPRRSVVPGSRLCVRSADGTITLLTVRQLTAPGTTHPSVLLDLTVWRAGGTSSPAVSPPAPTATSSAAAVRLLTDPWTPGQ